MFWSQEEMGGGLRFDPVKHFGLRRLLLSPMRMPETLV